MLKSLVRVFFLMLFCVTGVLAQGNEISFIAGGGRLSGEGGAVGAPAFTFSYTRDLIAGFAVEGSFDVFYVHFPGFRLDDYSSAQIGAVYHLPSIGKKRPLTPYVAAGLGNISTDFTEIRSDRVYRFAAGVKCFFDKDSPFAIRIELRDEITRPDNQSYPVTGSRLSLVSLRGGITMRF